MTVRRSSRLIHTLGWSSRSRRSRTSATAATGSTAPPRPLEGSGTRGHLPLLSPPLELLGEGGPLHAAEGGDLVAVLGLEAPVVGQPEGRRLDRQLEPAGPQVGPH